MVRWDMSSWLAPRTLHPTRKIFTVSAVNLPFLFLLCGLHDKMRKVMVEKPNEKKLWKF